MEINLSRWFCLLCMLCFIFTTGCGSKEKQSPQQLEELKTVTTLQEKTKLLENELQKKDAELAKKDKEIEDLKAGGQKYVERQLEALKGAHDLEVQGLKDEIARLKLQITELNTKLQPIKDQELLKTDLKELDKVVPQYYSTAFQFERTVYIVFIGILVILFCVLCREYISLRQKKFETINDEFCQTHVLLEEKK